MSTSSCIPEPSVSIMGPSESSSVSEKLRMFDSVARASTDTS